MARAGRGGWRRCGPARCFVSRRCCISTTIGCSTSTGTGARKSRCATTCWRCGFPEPTGDVPASERLFPAGFEEQREAAEIALAQAVTVLTGGPGTGKTTTVARLLALLAEQAGGVATADRVGGADRQGGGTTAGSRAA